MPEETVVPFRADPSTIATAKRVRSTLVSSSLNAIRKRGLLAKYETLVPGAHKEAILSCVAGVWLPMEVGIAHYSTCNALGLTLSEVYEIGMDVSVQVQASFLATLAKMARTAGVTPWTGLAQFQRLWDRVLDGGGVAVFQMGPKDARVEIAALPLVDIPYFRAAFRAFIVAGCNIFSTKAYGKDLPERRGDGRAAYRIAWA
jgi:hypothetical protein